MPLEDVQRDAFNKAIRTLTALDAKYKIILPDGEEVGDLEVVQRKATVRTYKHGEVREFARPHLFALGVGGTAKVPVGKFPIEVVQAGCCNFAADEWGKGNTRTKMNRAEGYVGVFREA